MFQIKLKKQQSQEMQYFDANVTSNKSAYGSCKTRRSEKDIILIGHEGHPEVEGTMGRHINKELSNIYLVQDESEALNINFSTR